MYDTRASLGQLRCAALNSLQAKAFRVEDGQLEPVCQLLFGAVGRQQQAVEAGVAGGQAVAVGAVALRARAAGGGAGQPATASGNCRGAIIPLCHAGTTGSCSNCYSFAPPGPAPPPHLDEAAQVAEPADGCAVGACEELEEQLALLGSQLVHHLPQPLDHAVLCRGRGGGQAGGPGRKGTTVRTARQGAGQSKTAASAGSPTALGDAQQQQQQSQQQPLARAHLGSSLPRSARSSAGPQSRGRGCRTPGAPAPWR